MRAQRGFGGGGVFGGVPEPGLAGSLRRDARPRNLPSRAAQRRSVTTPDNTCC